MGKSNVYVIHMDGTKFYKVGVGMNPKRRLKTLQTGNPYTLSLIKLIPCRSREEAYELEQALHDYLDKYKNPYNNSSSEWFYGKHIVSMVEDFLNDMNEPVSLPRKIKRFVRETFQFLKIQ